MAVMAKHVDAPFEIASDKVKAFEKAFNIPKGQRGSDIALARAKRHTKTHSFSTQDLTGEDLRIIADIRKIEINSRFMTKMLEKSNVEQAKS